MSYLQPLFEVVGEKSYGREWEGPFLRGGSVDGITSQGALEHKKVVSHRELDLKLPTLF